MEHTQHEANLINEDRRKQTDAMKERLERLGIAWEVAHFTGDSSHPTEYRLSYGKVSAVGPTFDLAVTEFIEQLLISEKAQAFQAMETALQILSGNVVNLRTELLVIKGMLASKESEE